MKVEKWVARAVLPVGLVCLLVWWWAPSLCKFPAVAKDEVAGCFEFWLNRYQTLLAGALALAAAAWATRPVYRQLTEMTRQSAAAAIPNLRTIAGELEEELSAMKLVDRQIDALRPLLREYDEEDLHALHANRWQNRVRTVERQVFEAWQFLGNRIDRDRRDAVLDRPAGLSVLRALINALTELDHAVHDQMYGPSYEDGAQDLPDGEHQRRRQTVDHVRATWTSWYEPYVLRSLEARRLAWDEVRNMERAAAPR